ncbi:hypothetical protein ACE193_01365 [Bernardetia sp. OM2101]|uniref:hypothetical protein n=1 Tax=Bernardetia sp. OM2101 TaxID=3344876 RepID=UPI0035CF8B32
MQNSNKKLQMAKAPHEIHQQDVFSDYLNETAEKGYYLEAQKALAPIPYAKKNRNLFIFSKGFAIAYHFVSFVLGIATVFLVSKAFYTGEINIINVLMATIVGALLIALLIGLEMFKSQSATDLFKSLSKSETASKGAKFGLLITFLLSVGLSAIGGAFLTVEMNDKSKIIQSELITQSDSLKGIYTSQLEGYEMSISSSKETLKKYSKGWRANNAREDLQAATEAKNNLLEKLDNRLAIESEKASKSILNNAKEGKETAFIVAFVVFILELITILCYRFKFIYLRNTEREGITFEVITNTTTSQAPAVREPLTELVETLKQLLENGVQSVKQIRPISNDKNYSQPSIGFQYQNTRNATVVESDNDKKANVSKKNTENTLETTNNNDNDTRNATVVERRIESGNRECLNCGTLFKYNNSVHKFCSKKCRWDNHYKKKQRANEKAKK